MWREQRHDRDAVSLMGGLLLVVLAVGFLVTDTTGLEVSARWVAPAVLVLVGAAGLLASLRAGSPSER